MKNKMSKAEVERNRGERRVSNDEIKRREGSGDEKKREGREISQE